MNDKIKVVWLEYPIGNRSYGGGGWSRRAKSRPAPERRELITRDVVITTGRSVIVAGQRKIKINLFNAATGAVIRADYPLQGLTEFGLSARQLGAVKAAATRAAAKKTAAAKMALANEIKSITTVRRLLTLPVDETIAGWIAGGCQHPAPAIVLSAKQKSGLSWRKFSSLNGGGAQ